MAPMRSTRAGPCGRCGMWIELFAQTGRPELFQKTGVLFTPRPGDPRAGITQAVFEKCGVAFHRLTPADLARLFPQFRFREERAGLFEPESGALLARRAVQAVVAQAVREGVEYKEETMAGYHGVGAIVYACGPWLPKIFPGDFRWAHSRHAPGGVFLWNSGRR